MQALRARTDDPGVQRIFARAGEVLGVAIANLINIFDPALIVLTGEGVQAGDLLLTPMREAIPRHLFGRPFDQSTLAVTSTDEIAWARGAASLIFQEVFHPPIYESGDPNMMDSLLALNSKSTPKRKAPTRAMTRR